VQKMRSRVHAAKMDAQRKVPGMPGAARARSGRDLSPDLPPAATAGAPHAHRTHPGAAALERIVSLPRRKDGGRHINIGASGYGKSYLTRALLVELKPRCKWIFTLDDKDARGTDYEGAEYVTVADFEANPPKKDDRGRRERQIVFRGDKYAGIECPAEEVAQLAQRFVQAEVPVCLNFDELKRAASGKSGMHWTAPTVKWYLTEARSLGGWFVGSSQSGKMFPEEALNEAGSTSVFRQKRKAARYLVDVMELDDEVADIIPSLDEGEFLLFTDEEDWDGRIYKL
jgi:hypothetical protein